MSFVCPRCGSGSAPVKGYACYPCSEIIQVQLMMGMMTRRPQVKPRGEEEWGRSGRRAESVEEK